MLGLIGGAVASRSAGIYFLMITLTYSVIADLHARPGDEDLRLLGHRRHQPYTPGWIGDILDHPNRLYYIALGVAIVVVRRHPLHRPHAVRHRAPGRARRADRDGSLGYNVPLHRTLAFGFGAFSPRSPACSTPGAPARSPRRRRPAADDQPADHGRDRRARPDRGRLDRRLRLHPDAELHHLDTHIPLLGFGGTLFGGSFNTIIGIIFLVDRRRLTDGSWAVGTALPTTASTEEARPPPRRPSRE
jgi:hypothetical protein